MFILWVATEAFRAGRWRHVVYVHCKKEWMNMVVWIQRMLGRKVNYYRQIGCLTFWWHMKWLWHVWQFFPDNLLIVLAFPWSSAGPPHCTTPVHSVYTLTSHMQPAQGSSKSMGFEIWFPTSAFTSLLTLGKSLKVLQASVSSSLKWGELCIIVLSWGLNTVRYDTQENDKCLVNMLFLICACG